MFSSFIFISLFCFIYFFSSPFLTRIFVDRIPAMETRGGICMPGIRGGLQAASR